MSEATTKRSWDHRCLRRHVEGLRSECWDLANQFKSIDKDKANGSRNADLAASAMLLGSVVAGLITCPCDRCAGKAVGS